MANAQRGIHSETVDIHRISGMTEFATDCKVAIWPKPKPV